MPPPPSKRRRVDGGVRTRGPRPELLTFDFAQRQEYLTGFHKRKQARIKHAQEVAARKEREEKIRDRKELRQKRKDELEEHVRAISGALEAGAGASLEEEGDAQDGWGGLSDEDDDDENTETAAAGAPAVQPVDHEDEYVDEERFTTVTVEEVGISKRGFDTTEGSEGEGEDSGAEEGIARVASANGIPAKAKQGRVGVTRQEEREGRPKKKRKKFKYESKSDRRVTKARERTKNSKAAKLRRGK